MEFHYNHWNKQLCIEFHGIVVDWHLAELNLYERHFAS